MTFTYIWANAEQTTLKREDADGNIAFVPTDPANRDYAEFLASGETAAAYVEPEPYVSPLEARLAALEANEISDDAVDSALLNLIAALNARITALEGGS